MCYYAELEMEKQALKKPLFMTDRIVFLGEVPRTNDFEGNAILEKKDGSD